MAKKDKWKRFINFSAVSEELTGTRSNIQSNYLMIKPVLNTGKK